MGSIIQAKLPNISPMQPAEAWNTVCGQLRAEMPKSEFVTWVAPLKMIGFRGGVFTLVAANSYGRDWVESHLGSRIQRTLRGLVAADLELKVIVANGNGHAGTAEAEADEAEAEPSPGRARKATPRSRKLMLERAYGTKRAAVIHPERVMFTTLYFFEKWIPLIGHSGFAVVQAARSLCYWNPITGERRNTLETDMAELAAKASVSVRTVKDVLNQELIKRYFLRYKVRRMMTPNGVRTAGILLEVRMDDPLTPDDQHLHELPEDERWWSAAVELFDEDDEE